MSETRKCDRCNKEFEYEYTSDICNECKTRLKVFKLDLMYLHDNNFCPYQN